MKAVLLLLALWASASWGQEKPVEYRLGPGDGIRISVFQNPNLTLETRVGEDGTITYPLVGRVRIGGLTLQQAEQVIAKGLHEGNYINQPQVSILSTQVRSSQVSVLGLVTRAGRFPLESGGTRVSEMLAMAGGLMPGASDVAVLAGERDGKPFRREIDIPALFGEKGAPEDVAVAARDVIYVHRAPVFYIYGEVQRPGSYRLERGMTVRQALAQGGGPTQRGTERSLRLYRGGKRAADPRPGDPVLADDVLHVGESIF